MRAAWSTVRASFHVDWDLLTPATAVITALPVAAVFALGVARGDVRAAIAMAIGANLIAIVSLVGAPALPVGLAVVDALTIGLSAFAGSVTGPLPWLHGALLAPLCFGAGMLVVFGQTQATVGTQAIIAYVALGRFSGSPSVALHLAVLVTAGSLVEVAALVIRWGPNLRAQRNRMAQCFEALAQRAGHDQRPSTDEVDSALDDAERALASPSLFDRTDVRALRSALDQARRMGLELTALGTLRGRLSSPDASDARAAIGSCLGDAATALSAIAAELRRPRRAASWQPPAAQYRQARTALEGAFVGDSDADRTARQCVDALAALGGQIRAAGNLVDRAWVSDHRPGWRPRLAPLPRPGIDQLRADMAVLRHHLRRDSPAFRHAVRMAVAVPASALLASWLSLPRGYWVPYAVAVILRPDYSTLLSRGVGRIIGTLLGATLAAIALSVMHPNLWVTTVLVALTAWAAYATWAASFPVAIGFVTALVLILLSASLRDGVGTAADRFLDVALGGAIAIATYLIWPASQGANVGETHAKLFTALREYLATVVNLVQDRPVDQASMATGATATLVAWSRAEAAVGRSIREPVATRLDPAQGQQLLDAARRIVRATQALRLEAERGATMAPTVELDALGAGFSQALDAIADAYAGRGAESIPELRTLYRALELRIIEQGPPSAIDGHLDELVNAIDTAGAQAGLFAPAPD